MAIYKIGEPVKLYTRGNGIVGKDISWIAKFAHNIPTSLNVNINIRGELIVPEDIFQKNFSHLYARAQGMVTGMINSSHVCEGMDNIHFATFEIISEDQVETPESQYNTLENLGFETAQYTISEKIDTSILTNLLTITRNSSCYYLDGLVVQYNKPVIRTNKKYPTYLIAFKIDASSIDVEVVSIQWKISKCGIYIPVVHIVPTKVGGVTISKATGHNAKFVNTHGIGPGSIVSVIRSGDVIPKIIEGVKMVEPQMPLLVYDWDENKVHIMSVDMSNPEIQIKRMYSFFHILEIKDFGLSRIRKVYENGLSSISIVLNSSVDELSDALDSQVLGAKIYEHMHDKIQNSQIYQIVGASGKLGNGIGVERIQKIVQHIPDIFTRKSYNINDINQEILQIPGFATKITDVVCANLETAIKFLNTISHLIHKTKNKEIVKSGNNLDGQLIVVTGFTDTEMCKMIESQGGVYSTNWKSGATMLVAGKKSLESESSKVKKAKSKNINIYSVEEFKNKYLV